MFARDAPESSPISHPTSLGKLLLGLFPLMKSVEIISEVAGLED